MWYVLYVLFGVIGHSCKSHCEDEDVSAIGSSSSEVFVWKREAQAVKETTQIRGQQTLLVRKKNKKTGKN